jgi:hypothetical protein
MKINYSNSLPFAEAGLSVSKDREAHAFHSWIRPAAEQRSRTRVSWRAASVVVILDGCESGGHYVAISVGSCP